jgi:hypothetical protein
MINAKLQNIIDTKSAIGNAIVNKGGTITGETPFFNYAAQIDGISTGTPQTIFAASDGSKWALTNAVNLTNVSNNVTHDFNYWQPANNSTSDPILNIGTVGANISGNIQLVPVNQVNIAQYSNFVINDTAGAKYVGYNGYDSVTNPTPTGNATFNRWLLNNSASGTIVFANTTIVSGGTYNGPNVSFNQSNMAFVSNSSSYLNTITTVATNNGFVYVGGFFTGANRGVSKYHESNLVLSGNTGNYLASQVIQIITTNDGFLYVTGSDISFAGGSGGDIKKYNESTLSLSSNSAFYGGVVYGLDVNNSFVYAGGGSVRTIKRYHESNLAFVNNSVSFGGDIRKIVINNGFVYAAGETTDGSYTQGRIRKYHESNLVLVENSANYGSFILALAVNNGFVYVGGGGTPNTVHKYHESNLAFVGNTSSYGNQIQTITTNNGFIYVSGNTNQTVQKFYESNLVRLANTVSYGADVRSVAVNNGFIYVGGLNNLVRKFQDFSLIPDNQTFYTATKIKE